jgi:dCTP deaminase
MPEPVETGLLGDDAIRAAVRDGLLELDPFEDDSVQPASYDLRVGAKAFISGDDEKTDVANKGLVIIDPGEFAVIETRERVRCGPQVAGQIGLSSTYARMGLTLLSGPQIDPGFDGILVVRVTNLSPKRVTLPYESPFLTAQFFKLARPVAKPYTGRRQGQTGIQPKDIQELSAADSPTIGGMVKSLASVAKDVAALSGTVTALATQMKIVLWLVPVLLGGIGIIVAVK